MEKTSLPVGDDDILELPWSPGLGWALQYVLELRGLAPDDVENNCEEKWEDYCALP